MTHKIQMPVIFIGHGSPMNAIEDNEFTKNWKLIAKAIPSPKAILCISAHWQTETTAVAGMKTPQTIHDFYGFPKALSTFKYPAQGSPTLAKRVQELITVRPVQLDTQWGLDHGCWSVLAMMYPKATIPVVQMSLGANLSPQERFSMGKQLSRLREEGILFLGTGNIVHNLGGEVSVRTREFDEFVKASLEKRNHDSLLNFKNHPLAFLAQPTEEHFLPLLYCLGAALNEKPVFFNERMPSAGVSMRCVVFGI